MMTTMTSKTMAIAEASPRGFLRRRRFADARGDEVGGAAGVNGFATGKPVDKVERLKGGDEGGDEHKEGGVAEVMAGTSW